MLLLADRVSLVLLLWVAPEAFLACTGRGSSSVAAAAEKGSEAASLFLRSVKKYYVQRLRSACLEGRCGVEPNPSKGRGEEEDLNA